MPLTQSIQTTACAVSTKAPASELSALTGVRFFAAAFVVFYHFGRPFLGHTPWPVAGLAGTGYAAVGFFFLLSGFVMTYSYVSRDGLMRGNSRSFWAARIARIYPAYLLAFLIGMPFNIIGSMHVNSIGTAWAKLLLGGASVLALLQAWTPWTAWYWNYPAWSLSGEAFFYLAFPVLVPLLGRLSKKQCLTLLPLVWLSLLALPAWYSAFHATTPDPIMGTAQLAVEVTPLFRLPEFVMGMLLGRVFILGRSEAAIGNPQWLAYAGIAAAALLLSFGLWIPRPLIASGLTAPFSALVIFGLAHGTGWLAKFLSLRPLILLGEASYGIYIFQVPIANVFGIDSTPGSPVRSMFFVVGLIAVSVMVFKFVEQPLRPLLRTRLLKLLDGKNRPVDKMKSRAAGTSILRGNV